MKPSKILTSAALAAALCGCEGGEPQNPPTSNPDPTSEVCNNPLSGTLAKSCKLTADRRWLLKGQVLVPAGATLTIETGTTVTGAVGNPVSFLNVDRGAKLIAQGTAERPIVFTSERAPGDRTPGDWGGVVLRGRATINLPGGEGSLEGEAGQFGGGQAPDDNDSSGVLRYVRIEFAGREIAPDNELNGLTLGGVGRGTRIEYLQVHRGLDDGIEVFGGTVDLKRCVVTGAEDDGLDWDLGWTGRAQFFIAQQQLKDGNNGIEADNFKDNNDLQPRSSPTVYNLTLWGTGRNSTPMGQPRIGLTLRRGTAGHLHNLIVSGFLETGVYMTEDSTVQRVSAGQLELTHSLFFENGRSDEKNVYDPAQKNLPKDPADPAQSFDIGRFLMQEGKQNRQADPQLERPFDIAAPRFQPRAGSPVLSGAKAPPQDGFFEAVDYVGGVGPERDWLAGWTAFPAN